ncbi:hypothetical protein HF324_20520 [Chitinophaga oryzae]|uniref:Uncharacterized protein n=1 Tax=Chitinophaga oryzae TaxID=2725414 RepID=A0ABX6LJ57_9BACT|nr:hypothetical protein [Chitinophaga oryzae]QJB40111.1 hypothetical protein HF324_20520 [Chitinophaga oryzae]
MANAKKWGDAAALKMIAEDRKAERSTPASLFFAASPLIGTFHCRRGTAPVLRYRRRFLPVVCMRRNPLL